MNVKTTAISKAPLCKTLDIADEQRVFVVGDLDGDYQKLQAQLNKVSFNPQDDVLISLGDIIDRGQDSADAGDPAAQMIERTDLVVIVHGRQMPRYATRQGHGLNCLGRVQDRHTRL